MTTIQVGHGLLFAVALPHRGGDLVWRGARRSDPTIARPLWESDLEQSVVLVYRAGHAGTTTLVYALTKGETFKAYEARFFKIIVK